MRHWTEYEQTLQRYMRLSRRRDGERVASARAEVHEARARLLDVRLRFISSLNALRYKRAFVFLEPLSGYLQVRLLSRSSLIPFYFSSSSSISIASSSYTYSLSSCCSSVLVPVGEPVSPRPARPAPPFVELCCEPVFCSFSRVLCLQVFLTSAKLASDLASKRGLEKTLDELNVFLAQYASPAILAAHSLYAYGTVRVHTNHSSHSGYILHGYHRIQTSYEYSLFQIFFLINRFIVVHRYSIISLQIKFTAVTDNCTCIVTFFLDCLIGITY